MNFSFWPERESQQCEVAYKGITYTGYMTLCAAISRAMDEGESTCGASYIPLIMWGWFYCFSVLLAPTAQFYLPQTFYHVGHSFIFQMGFLLKHKDKASCKLKKPDLCLGTETEWSFSRVHRAKNTLDSLPQFLPLHISQLIHSSCICTLSFNLYCWEIAYNSPCGCESLIISLNASGNRSIMSHIMFYTQYLVGVAFGFGWGFVRKT